MSLYFFESGKKIKGSAESYKDQIHIFVPRERVLNLIANIAQKAAEKETDDFIDIGLAGEMTKK